MTGMVNALREHEWNQQFHFNSIGSNCDLHHKLIRNGSHFRIPVKRCTGAGLGEVAHRETTPIHGTTRIHIGRQYGK
ncbi:hypothetical protein ACIG63_00930 [Streptomyces antimycoticus]|uniref:hypothetical protein n=1 Tax=Streptomyces antimycoticus TaxID=68175 RepID=UPI0037D49FB5